MSRIGKLPVPVPSGVDVTIDGPRVTVKGPKGTLSHTVVSPITVAKAEDGALAVTRPDDERESRSRHGLTRTLVNNMVVGVTEGYITSFDVAEAPDGGVAKTLTITLKYGRNRERSIAGV